MMRFWMFVVLAVTIAGTGCGHREAGLRTAPDSGDLAPTADWPDAADCLPLTGTPTPGGDFVVAVGHEVDPDHAPVPLNPAERTVFANCYETLTVVNCAGEVESGLASAWHRQDGGRLWRLELRHDAVFWDGTPVTARDVALAWSRNLRLARATNRPCPGLWLDTAGRGLKARGGRVLEIRLAEPQDDLPRLLAHPALAISARREGWLWPVGSGPCRLAADTDLPRPDLRCQPNPHHPDAPRWHSVTFRVRPGVDARDLLTEDVDLAVVRQRRAAAYAAELAGVRSAALPWDRKYVLLVPPGRESRSGYGVEQFLAGAEVTPAESRTTSSLVFRGCRRCSCPQLHGPTVGVAMPPVDADPARAALTAGRLYHLDGDADAEALAARMAAFGDDQLTAYGVSALTLAQALEAGDAAGYVVGLDACYPAACLTIAALVAHTGWLQATIDSDENDACAAEEALIAVGRVVPLVDTRARLVWRGPIAGLRLTHDGALLVHDLGIDSVGALP